MKQGQQPKPTSRLWLVVIVIVSALQIGACSTGVTPPTDTAAPPVITPSIGRDNPELTLRMIYHEAPTILNPYLAAGNKDIEVSRIFYEPLATLDGAGNMIPFLAADVPSVENGGLASDLTWVTWKLKSGVHWSDGQPFTAEDVKFTYDYVTNPDVGSSYASFYNVIAGVEIVDDYTIRVDFKGPTPGWAVPFVNKAGMILPRHIFEDYNGKNAKAAPANREPVGTGPYRIVGKIKQQEVLFLGSQLVYTNKITAEPNPFFREADTLYFQRVTISGGGTVEQAFRTVLEKGTADYAYLIDLTDQQQKQMLARGNGRIQDTTGSNVLILALNFTDPTKGSILEFSNPIFSDPAVRQALAHAVDRDRITKEVYDNTAIAESNYIAVPQDKAPITFYPFDLKAAAALLDQAGWIDSDGDGIREKDGQQLQIKYQTTVGPRTQGVLRIISDDLTSIGFGVEADIKDPNAYFGQASNPDTYLRFGGDLAMYPWFFDAFDQVSKFSYWTCGAIPTPQNGWSGYNVMRWCNPEFDTLFAQALSEVNEQRRMGLIRQMNDIMINDVAMVVIAQTPQRSAVSLKLQGFSPTPWDAEVWNIKDWKKATSP